MSFTVSVHIFKTFVVRSSGLGMLLVNFFLHFDCDSSIYELVGHNRFTTQLFVMFGGLN